MSLSKKEKTTKYLIYCAIIALSALLQNVAGLWFQIGNARCFFLIPVALLFSIDEEEKTAGLLGLFAGVLWDCVVDTHHGFNAAFLMLMCFVMSTLVSHLLRATYWVGVVSSSVFTLLYVLIYWLIYVVSKGGDGANASFFNFYFPSFVYTSVMAALLNLAIIPIKRKLNKE